MSALAATARRFKNVMESCPIVFGEVLFDAFPGGQRVLGGAPFNVAWHLHGFGAKPLFISRVGDDDPGRAILGRMTDWGMSTRGIQVDPMYPTGRVRVTIDEGEPSFEIEAEQSYDFIEPDLARSVTEGAPRSLLYHGSLAIRCERSWKALEALGVFPGGIVCDVNLREPWWSRERLEWCLDRASWIKMNDHELETITALPTTSREQCLLAARALVRRQGHANMIVTRGQHGVLGLFADREVMWQDAPGPARLVDTVGAGDAFSAVMILGVLRGWDRAVLLRNAAAFAADICQRRGATADDPSVYRRRFN